jgi:hypothetical protein
MIDSIDQTPRCGDVKATYWSSAPLGWMPMNDSTIGNTGSGATPPYAGQFMFQLYKTIWDAVSNTYAPVAGGRGATAQADFIANKALTLPLSLGRSIAATGMGAVLGQNAGANSATFTIGAANLPPHSHTYTFTTVGAGFGFGFASGTNLTTATGNTGNGPGTSTAITLSTLPLTSFMNIYIKL